MNPLLPIGIGGALLLLLTGSSKAASGSSAAAPSGSVSTDGGTRYYTVAKGDYPGLIAQKLTGDAGRWLELTRANPSKAVWTYAEVQRDQLNEVPNPTAQVGNFKTLVVGEKLILPEGW